MCQTHFYANELFWLWSCEFHWKLFCSLWQQWAIEIVKLCEWLIWKVWRHASTFVIHEITWCRTYGCFGKNDVISRKNSHNHVMIIHPNPKERISQPTTIKQSTWNTYIYFMGYTASRISFDFRGWQISILYTTRGYSVILIYKQYISAELEMKVESYQTVRECF